MAPKKASLKKAASSGRVEKKTNAKKAAPGKDIPVADGSSGGLTIERW